MSSGHGYARIAGEDPGTGQRCSDVPLEERGADPLRISQEECEKLVSEAISGTAASPSIHEFEEAGISVVNGRYGPYIKYDGRNFRIPRGTDAAALTEEDCRKIIAEAPAPDAAPKTRRFKQRS